MKNWNGECLFGRVVRSSLTLANFRDVATEEFLFPSAQGGISEEKGVRKTDGRAREKQQDFGRAFTPHYSIGLADNSTFLNRKATH